MKLRQRKAFTLLELLIVITIIAVLVALLMPALTTARNRAKTAQCINNQRQAGAGWGGYLNDHNGHYPYQFPINQMEPNDGWSNWDPVSGQLCAPTSGYSWSCMNAWYLAFAPYIGGQGVDKFGHGPFTTAFYTIMRCPANPWPTSNFYDTNEYYGAESTYGYPPWSPSSYSLNNQLLPLTWGLPQGSGSGCGLSYNNPNGWYKRASMNDILHPASAAMMLENPLCPGHWNAVSTGFFVDNPWTRLNGAFSWLATEAPMPFEGGGGLYGGSDASFVTNYCNVSDPRYQGVWLRPDCNYQVSTFHNLGMNVLFFDGHVDRISKNTLFSYSCDVLTNGYCGGYFAGPNNSPGGMFWTDGRGEGANYYYNQLPDYQVYP